MLKYLSASLIGSTLLLGHGFALSGLRFHALRTGSPQRLFTWAIQQRLGLKPYLIFT